MSQKLFLLDAMALVFRAYYALIRNPRITSKGRNTNAQFGFTTTLVDLINNQRPTHMAVCFDTEAPTERHSDFTEYKANRQEAPEDLLSALPDIKRIIAGFNIPVIELDGYEADDVIGTLSIQAANAGYEVYMVTPDKDYGQLVSERIRIYKPPYQGSSPEILGPKEVCEKWAISDVSQVVDILGLMGDSVDNIPGIPGVGEKTASKLLAEYVTLESVLENADKIKGALGEKIRKGRESALISKRLATIITHVPVTFHEENFRLKEWNKDALREVFAELEFKTLGKRILGDEFNAFEDVRKKPANGQQQDLFDQGAACTVPPEQNQPQPVDITAGLIAEYNINNVEHNYMVVDTDEGINQLISQLQQYKEISFDTETTCLDANDAELVGLSFSVKAHEGYYIPCPPDQSATNHILELFRPLFSNPSITWVGQNIKYDLLVLKWYGVELEGPVFDTMLAHYVIEPDGKRSMDLLSAQYLKYEPIHIEELIGKKGKTQGNMRDVPIDKIKEYAAEDADITLQLKHAFTPQLTNRQVDRVFNEVENPLVKVLMEMEYEGIKVDVGFLNSYS
ncbi:MAG TPA: 5'-3' exonuclease H3TH domain-containing protein, partial [Chitinophagaceae bacterium]|nr:5'-3' exonuclease H3TH domain-containing protein [Chitinophagaceae bacterium]